jgi:hypothetical protein
LARDDEILLSKGDFDDPELDLDQIRKAVEIIENAESNLYALEDERHKTPTTIIENIESPPTLVQNVTEEELNRLQSNIVSAPNEVSNDNFQTRPESSANNYPIEIPSDNPPINPPNPRPNNNIDEERREGVAGLPIENNHLPQPTERNEKVDETSFRPPPICNDGYLANIPDNRVTTPRAVCNDDFLGIVDKVPIEPRGATTTAAQSPTSNAPDLIEKGNKEPLLKKKPRKLLQSASTPIKMYVIANKYRDKLFLLPMPRTEKSSEVEVVTIFKKGKRERTQNTRPKRIRVRTKEVTATTPKNRREKVKATRRSR